MYDGSPAPRRFSIASLLAGLFLLGTVLFAGLSIYAFAKAGHATSTLTAAKAAASAQAHAEQHKLDITQAEAAAESPFRSYNAPEAFGAFTINFPKNWSARVAEDQTNQTQVNLSLNPNFISYHGGLPDPVAARVRLIEESSSTFIANFTEQIQSKKVAKSTTTVSNQPAIMLVGPLGAADPSVKLVIVPVRDKIIVISTENSNYLSEFDQIVAQAVIKP